MSDAPGIADSPEVTVIVVSFNHAPFVTETLDSIARQTHAPARVVIVDDASSDDSAQVIAAWAQASSLDTHLVLNTENRGLCPNLNRALALVDTPLYAYISADDRMLPHRLERQVARWVEGGKTAAAVYSDALRIDEHGRRLLPDYSDLVAWPEPQGREGRIFDDLLSHNWIPAASVLLDTAAVRVAGGYDDELFYEDHDLWLRLARTREIACVDEALVEVRELESSLGGSHFSSNSLTYQDARLRILLKHFGASEAADRYVGAQVPKLAVSLWEAGVAPELVGRALALSSHGRATPGLTARLTLVRAGVTREPRAFRAARIFASRRSR